MEKKKLKRLQITVTGRVQGVGFRYFTQSQAIRLHLTGWVKNCEDASVLIEVQGPSDVLEEFVHIIRKGPPLAYVEHVDIQERPIELEENVFRILRF